MLERILNRFRYYRISQLKIGGMCGCCGKAMPKLIWFDEGHNWSDIGICNECCGDKK